MIVAIARSTRRRVLRLLNESGEASSPVKMADELGLSVGMVGYHVRVLEGLGAVESTGEEPVRGAVEHFYRSLVIDDPPIETLLEETREKDEGHE